MNLPIFIFFLLTLLYAKEINAMLMFTFVDLFTTVFLVHKSMVKTELHTCYNIVMGFVVFPDLSFGYLGA